MNLFKKIILMLLGLFIMGIAMALLTAADMGISPVQSLAYVISQKIPHVLTFGLASMIWNFILLGIQIALLRREFRLWELLQIPLSLYFGVVIDLARKIVTVSPETMASRLFTMLFGVVVLAVGILLTVEAGLVMNSGEATVKAIAKKLSKPFSTIKVAFDVTIVLSASVACFLLFNGFRFDMIGIGTLSCAVLTGVIIKGLNKLKGYVIK